MAEREQRRDLNAPGAFYVDENCERCGLCWITAPENFRADPDRRAFVFVQPVTERQRADCEEALTDCPMQAIGCDGA